VILGYTAAMQNTSKLIWEGHGKVLMVTETAEMLEKPWHSLAVICTQRKNENLVL